MALDLETSGLNRERDRIIQYGIFGCNGTVRGCISHTAVVDAETPTGRDPRNLPGVPPAEVRAARPLRDGHLDVLFRALHRRIVIMHNGAHDWTFVQNEFRRHARMPPTPLLRLCTYSWARRARLPGSLVLSDLCQRFRVALPVAHHAWHDARATFYLAAVWMNDTTMWAHRPPGLLPQHLQTCSAYFLPPPTIWAGLPPLRKAAADLPDLEKYEFSSHWPQKTRTRR